MFYFYLWFIAVLCGIAQYHNQRFPASVGMLLVLSCFTWAGVETHRPAVAMQTTPAAVQPAPEYYVGIAAAECYHAPGCPMLARLLTFPTVAAAEAEQRKPCPLCLKTTGRYTALPRKRSELSARE